MVEAWRLATLPEDRKATTSAMMTLALDDPSPRVRAALANGLAPMSDAPWHVIRALLRDVPYVAEIVLRLAESLPQDELSALIRGGAGHLARTAAARPDVSDDCAHAILESGCPRAVTALLSNGSILLPASLLERIADRHAHDADVRANLMHQDLSSSTRQRLVGALADDLAALVSAKGWTTPKELTRTIAVSQRGATFGATRGASTADKVTIVERMIDEGRIDAGFLMAAATGGRGDLVAVAVAALSGLPITRVVHSLNGTRSAGQWRISCERAGLDPLVAAALRSATGVWHRLSDRSNEVGMGEGAYDRASTLASREAIRAAIAELDVTRHAHLLRELLDAEVDLERTLARDHSEVPLLAAA